MHLTRALFELQERDIAILRLERELEEMPEKRAILSARTKLAEIEGIRERSQAAVHAMDAIAKRLEDEIAALSSKMDKEQAKLVSGEVANPKELQAVSLELESLRRRVMALEGQLLNEMQKQENGAAQLAKIDAAMADGRRAEESLTNRFKAHGGSVLASIESEKQARTALLPSVDVDTLARYESLRATRHGIAVGRLEGSMCSACRVTLPSVKVATLESGPDVATCPGCGRILIVRGE